MKILTKIIARLVLEIVPEAKTEIDAMRQYRATLTKAIDVKVAANIKATEDIEFWFVMCQAITDMELNGSKKPVNTDFEERKHNIDKYFYGSKNIEE